MPVIALVGNPNSGKTTLFNALTGARQFVGNWPGVTVERKEGALRRRPGFRVLDLPGTYSLSPFSPEEIVARDALLRHPPDIVLNIVDGTNLERNLYLTMQLLELGLPLVVAVNCVDVLRRRGDVFSAKALRLELGCPVVEISALKGEGLERLVAELVRLPPRPPGHLPPIEDTQDAIARRYDRIEQLTRHCLRRSGKPDVSQRVDDVLLHRWLALPIFVLVMFAVYYLAASGPGVWVSHAIESFIAGLGDVLAAHLTGWPRGLVVDGVLGGAGLLLGFVPQLLLVFACLALLESCGYLARIAFLLDVVLRRFGLSGKCFMPMLLATGCAVPAILATRAIDCPCQRRATAITCSFLPCSAKLPVIALIAGALFGGAWWLAPLMYFTGMAAMLLSALLLTRIQAQRSDGAAPQVLELPPYRLPSLKHLSRSTWERSFSFVKKAGSVIVLSSVFVWLLSGAMEPAGRAIAWAFVPLGFGQWQAAVATLTAFAAKENAVATLGVLYGTQGIAQAFTPAAGLSFLLFNLLSMPCVAAVSALHRELGKTKHTLAAVGGQCVLAYAVSFVVYWGGGMIASF